MAVNWDKLVIRRYYDKQTQKWIEVNIMVKDAIFFELLLNILNELKRR